MLKSYLEETACKGRLDSVGSFTFDASNAKRRLASSLFPDSRCYLLKFVQAANLSNCTSIDIHLKGPIVEIRLNGWPANLGVTKNLHFLSSASPAFHSVQLGIVGLQAQDIVDLKVDTGELEFSLRARRPLSALRDCGRESAFLRKHVQYSKVPVFLNGKRLDSAEPPAQFHKPVWNEFLPHGSVLAECDLARSGGRVYLRIGLQRRAEILFIRSGVLVGMHKTTLPVRGIQAVIDAGELETDLTGLKIVENDKLVQCLARVTEAAEILRAEVREKIDQILAEKEPFSLGAEVRWSKRVSATALGIVGTGVALLALTGDVVTGTFLLGSPLLTCATVATATLAGGDVLKPSEESHQRLREQILKRLSLPACEQGESEATCAEKEYN
jgi:hypothetical protein